MKIVKSRGEDELTTYCCEHFWKYVKNDLVTYVEKYHITKQLNVSQSKL